MGMIRFGDDPRCGWHPEFTARAKERLAASGQMFRGVRALPKPTEPFSLSRFRYRVLDQGGAGSCWVHGPTHVAETVGVALGLDVFPLCRRLTGYVGKSFEGGGNMSDGGSGYDAFQAMSQSNGGVGVAHEDLCPYTDDYRTLGHKPPQTVYDDAKVHWLDTPLSIDDMDTAIAMGAQQHPVAIGIWWPNSWGDPNYLQPGVGRGSYGHEVVVWGWTPPGILCSEECIEIANSWNEIYPPLPSTLAAKVPGYTPSSPDKTDSFWVTRSDLETCIAKGNAEFSTMTSMGSFADFIDLDGFNI